MFCFCGCSTQKEMGFCLSFLWIVIAQTRNFLQSKLTKLLPRKSDVQYRNCSFCALVWPMPLALQILSLFSASCLLVTISVPKTVCIDCVQKTKDTKRIQLLCLEVELWDTVESVKPETATLKDEKATCQIHALISRLMQWLCIWIGSCEDLVFRSNMFLTLTCILAQKKK